MNKNKLKRLRIILYAKAGYWLSVLSWLISFVWIQSSCDELRLKELAVFFSFLKIFEQLGSYWHPARGDSGVGMCIHVCLVWPVFQTTLLHTDSPLPIIPHLYVEWGLNKVQPRWRIEPGSSDQQPNALTTALLCFVKCLLAVYEYQSKW